MLTFDGKGVVLHRDDLREATRRAAEKRRQQREPLSPFKRLKPGEKKHAKRMATVAAVYKTAPLVRSPEEFLQSLMPRQPVAKPRAKPPPVRPRPVAKRVWASLEREPWEVVAEATLEAEHQDPEHVKRWGRIPDFPVTRSHPPASWPSAANSSICRTYRKTAGEESRRRSPVANRWMRP